MSDKIDLSVIEKIIGSGITEKGAEDAARGLQILSRKRSLAAIEKLSAAGKKGNLEAISNLSSSIEGLTSKVKVQSAVWGLRKLTEVNSQITTLGKHENLQAIKDISESIENIYNPIKIAGYKHGIKRLVKIAGKDGVLEQLNRQGAANIKDLSESMNNISNPLKIIGFKWGLNQLTSMIGTTPGFIGRLIGIQPTKGVLQEINEVASENIKALGESMSNISNPLKIIGFRMGLKSLQKMIGTKETPGILAKISDYAISDELLKVNDIIETFGDPVKILKAKAGMMLFGGMFGSGSSDGGNKAVLNQVDELDRDNDLLLVKIDGIYQGVNDIKYKMNLPVSKVKQGTPVTKKEGMGWAATGAVIALGIGAWMGKEFPDLTKGLRAVAGMARSLLKVEKISKSLKGLSFLDDLFKGGGFLAKIAGAGKKVVGKGAMKIMSKTLLAGILKKIPLVGAGAGLYFAYERLMKGQTTAAVFEAMSGMASLIPGPGTAISLAIDAGLLAYDAGLKPMEILKKAKGVVPDGVATKSVLRAMFPGLMGMIDAGTIAHGAIFGSDGIADKTKSGLDGSTAGQASSIIATEKLKSLQTSQQPVIVQQSGGGKGSSQEVPVVMTTGDTGHMQRQYLKKILE